MSQYPSPYSPPQFPSGPGLQPPVVDPLASARRASVLLIILGSLGLCVGASLTLVPRDQIETAMNQMMSRQGMVPPNYSIDRMILQEKIVAVVFAVAGALFVALGIGIRRANKVSAVFATIFCGLGSMFFGVNVLGGLAMAITGNTFGVFTVCVSFIPLALLVLEMTWLMKLLRALPHIEGARRQWEAYYASARQNQLTQLGLNYYQGPQGSGYAGDLQQNPPSPGYAAISPLWPTATGAPPANQPSRDVQPDATRPEVRHPPLPPDQQNSPVSPNNPRE